MHYQTAVKGSVERCIHDLLGELAQVSVEEMGVLSFEGIEEVWQVAGTNVVDQPRIGWGLVGALTDRQDLFHGLLHEALGYLVNILETGLDSIEVVEHFYRLHLDAVDPQEQECEVGHHEHDDEENEIIVGKNL